MPFLEFDCCVIQPITWSVYSTDYAIPFPTKGNRELSAFEGCNILVLLCCGNSVNMYNFPGNSRCFHLGQKESKCGVNYYAVPLFPCCCYVLLCTMCCVICKYSYFIYITQKNPPLCISDIFISLI